MSAKDIPTDILLYCIMMDNEETLKNKRQLSIDMLLEEPNQVGKYADLNGRVKISDLVEYFKKFYTARRSNGLIVEKDDSIFARDNCSDKQIEREILSYPFKRFENMSMMHHTKTLGVIQIDPLIWKKLTDIEKKLIEQVCDEKLAYYYQRINKKKE